MLWVAFNPHLISFPHTGRFNPQTRTGQVRAGLRVRRVVTSRPKAEMETLLSFSESFIPLQHPPSFPSISPHNAITTSTKGNPAVAEACLSWRNTLYSFCGRGKREPGARPMAHGLLPHVLDKTHNRRSLLAVGITPKRLPYQGNNNAILEAEHFLQSTQICL